MHIPHLCYMLINSLLFIIPWITVKLTLVFFFQLSSRLSEMLKRQVPDYLPPIIIYVQVSFLLQKVVSVVVDWNFILPATLSQLDTNLVGVPLWYVWIVGVQD